MAIDYEYFKNKLEQEKTLVEEELAKVGRRNPDNLSDWEATPPIDRDSSSQADEDVTADNIGGYKNNITILNTLETRYNDLKSGLDKIKHRVYGLCQVCQREIEGERLGGNPSPPPFKAHM